MIQPILQIEDLHTHFFTDRGEIPAVDGVNLYVNPGEVLGVVGESGCGKSVTSLSVLKLIPQPPGKIVGGSIFFKGRDIVPLKEREMRSIRGNAISMIFQEPMTSLNPLYTIGQQIGEAVRLHKGLSKKEARAHTIDMLKKGRHSKAGSDYRRVSPSVVRGDAPAGDDRHGDFLQPGAADRR